jgi:hypothetical protein
VSDQFESLTRTLGTGTSRRQALKIFGAAAMATVAATILKPFRAQGQPNCIGSTPCGETCCPAGVSCIDRATSKCGCPSGTTQCGPNKCCPAGIICRNAATGTCGCPYGAGQCGTGCCKAGETCSDPNSACCCPSGTTPCGPACCKGGVACIDRTKGTCGCPSGYTQCVKNGVVTCCPAGKACGSDGCVAASSLNTTVKTCGGGTHPECAGATCSTFIPCSSSNGDCVCVAIAGGGGICVPGSTACASLQDCGENNSCPPGSVCGINSCCGHGECIPETLAALCPQGPPV